MNISQLLSRYRPQLIVVVAVLVAAATGYSAWQNQAGAAVEPATFATGDPGELVVDVQGAVVTPGVRHVPAGSLLEDVLAAAGGLTDQADTDRLAREMNRAEPVKNHQKIYVPLQGEAAGSGGSAGGELVNLNSATAVELEELPGIGEATARKIIDYRESNGPFASVDDLTNVPGIGEAKLAQLRELVTV